jgi:hypothetical protein
LSDKPWKVGFHNHLNHHSGGHDAFRVRFAGALAMPAKARTLANPKILKGSPHEARREGLSDPG